MSVEPTPQVIPTPEVIPQVVPRASDRDRDDVLVRLHTAYAEGRLDDRELDERIDLVLAARTQDELDTLTAELPASGTSLEPAGGAPAAPAGRFQMAYKSTVRRSGRWRLPERYTAAVYKGECVLDLRQAEFAARTTRLRVVAYKSVVEIVVPPGVHVEVSGLGLSSEIRGAPSPSAPTVHVRGVAHKGAIEVVDHLRLP